MERKTEYGHGELAFFVIEGERVIQFKMLLGFGSGATMIEFPMATDLGYHSPDPMYEGQSPMDGDCRFTTGPCYYDGTSLGANKPLRILQESGEEALWAYLENHWRSVFEEKNRVGGVGEIVDAISKAAKS